ncbi:RnfABCDGE type electron transport complex subunit D [Martelella endophytica]|uniref:Ion-translocating oxidoreductase complex subunit D n=1 Tax=Martelella endophytica TaxID=1486262 RepID=A0A0D5LSM6_MAREN|nr:RnfABCDGE type electron transport complex subunit D [Martelella endophytica]AJY46787.1 electron transporter RnfD [Martelella endophytica]
MSMATPLGGPFTHSGASISRTMTLVMAALLPATIFGLYQFGWPAIFLFLVTVVSAVLAEFLALRMAGKPVMPFISDGSAMLTGWLIAMSLPPWAPWWVGVLGSFIAILLAKHPFDGIGQNLFNPAMVARTVLLISFPVEMTRFVAPMPLGSADAPGFISALEITFGLGSHFDAMSSASFLGSVKTQLGQAERLPDILASGYHPFALAFGTVSGSTGETSALFLLAGGLFLLATRIISWHIPIAMIITMVALSGIFHFIDPNHFLGPVMELSSGTFIFATFFIATDYVTAPSTPLGKLIFGAGVAALTFLIRTFAAYPEGVAFSILLMNATVPIIDHTIRPRIYGRTRKGVPIQHKPK